MAEARQGSVEEMVLAAVDAVASGDGRQMEAAVMQLEETRSAVVLTELFILIRGYLDCPDRDELLRAAQMPASWDAPSAVGAISRYDIQGTADALESDRASKLLASLLKLAAVLKEARAGL